MVTLLSPLQRGGVLVWSVSGDRVVSSPEGRCFGVE